MARYRLALPRYARFEGGAYRTYRAGDEIELTAKEAADLGERAQLIAPQRPPAAPQPSEAEAIDGSEVLAHGNVADARALIAELRTAEEVEALLATERDGKARIGVVTAAEARLDELLAPGPEEGAAAEEE